MFIPRNLQSALQRLIRQYPILAVTGPRQSGKTTLLKRQFPDYQYVSLENADMRSRAEDDPNSFLKKYNRYVIFDEVQRTPQLFSYLQTKVDKDEIMGQFILSGSQNFLLLKNIQQSLAGRVAMLKLLPLSISELEAASLLAPDWEPAAQKGFYPALFKRKIESPDFYPHYIETYLERDVRNLIQIKDLSSFRLFLKRCAGHAGHLLNLSELARDCGISSPTAKAWLSVLESSFILFKLPPYFTNFNKRLIKRPKLYFYDTGLLCHLLGITSPSELDTYYQAGNIFENLIIADLCKQHLHQGQQPNFYFLQDSNKNEIDLLTEKAGQLYIAEIKASRTLTNRHFKQLEKISRNTPLPIAKKTLIYAGDEAFEHKGIQIRPWNKAAIN